MRPIATRNDITTLGAVLTAMTLLGVPAGALAVDDAGRTPEAGSAAADAGAPDAERPPDDAAGRADAPAARQPAAPGSAESADPGIGLEQQGIKTYDDINQTPTGRPSTGSRPTSRGAGEMKPPSPTTGLGGMLVKMLLALGAVCLIAWAILKWGVSRLVGGTAEEGGPIEVIARKPLGPETAISVVRVGPRTLILGEGQNQMNCLGELDEAELEQFEAAQQSEQSADQPLRSLWRFGGGDEDTSEETTERRE